MADDEVNSLGRGNQGELYDLIREGEDTILRVDFEASTLTPSLEDSPVTMAKTVEFLIENPGVTKIVFVQKRDYEYGFHQTQLLHEIGKLFTRIVKQKEVFGNNALLSDPLTSRCTPTMHATIQRIIFRLLKSDPLGAYVFTKRMERRETMASAHITDTECIPSVQRYIGLLKYLVGEMEKTKLIILAKPHLPGFTIGQREVYRQIFRPLIKPDFMFTHLMANYPPNGTELDNYTLSDDIEVTVFEFPDSVRYLYHVMPPEFRLEEDEYEILDNARRIMAEHKPKKSEFTNPQRMREVFYNVGRDLIEELVEYRGYKISQKQMDIIGRILVRYTVGFGLIEVLLSDEKIQDISVNSPMGSTPIFVVHQDFGDCYTNIIPTRTEAESWASKLRLISGRPLDEANQILDTELEIPGASTRVSVITEPLDPTGLAFSFRRHRDKPWTLPLFCKVGMITPLAAGLISFLVDGTRTMLVCGTRSSGKSSFLAGILVEIMRRYRIITIEDTLELPTGALRKLGYNIQNMKVASALAKGGSEMDASDGIRATLRLGDSALIVGEVRSKEAIALYEAMRVGAAANVVAGTIHSDSPYGVFDRVVNDIGVPRTSFKATDVILVANPVRSADGIHRFRRVTQITEVRKHWEQDPMAEHGFVDLFKYDAIHDSLEPSADLMNGDSEVLKSIAANVKEFAGNWDAVWENITLRAKTKETLVTIAKKTKDDDLLEAPFVIKSNEKFHKVIENVRQEVGSIDSKRVFFEWNEWLEREVKKRHSASTQEVTKETE